MKRYYLTSPYDRGEGLEYNPTPLGYSYREPTVASASLGIVRGQIAERVMAEGPMTEEERIWIEENIRLLNTAAKTTWAAGVGGVRDAVQCAVPGVVFSLRRWTVDGGSMRANYAFNMVRMVLSKASARPGTVWFPYSRNGQYPILWGDCEPVPLDHEREEEDQTELLDDIRRVFDTLRPRWKMILDLYLGLTKPAKSASEIARHVRLTKTRVHQIINAALRKIAEDCKVRPRSNKEGNAHERTLRTDHRRLTKRRKQRKSKQKGEQSESAVPID